MQIKLFHTCSEKSIMGHSLFKGGNHKSQRGTGTEYSIQVWEWKEKERAAEEYFLVHKVMPNLVQPLKGWRRNPIITQKRKDTTNIYKIDHLDSPYGRKKWAVTSFLSFTQCDITCPKWTLWVKAKITDKYKIIILKSMCKAVKDTGSWETEGYIGNLIVYFVNVFFFFLVPWRSSRAEEQYKDSQKSRQMRGLEELQSQGNKILRISRKHFQRDTYPQKSRGIPFNVQLDWYIIV